MAQTAGPPQQIQALSDANVKQTAGPPQQIQAISDANFKQTAGPPQEIETLSFFLPPPVIPTGSSGTQPRFYLSDRRFNLPGPIS